MGTGDAASEDPGYVEVVRLGDGVVPAVVTCEHASEALPPPYRFSEADQRLVGTHWAYDPGAADLARALAALLGTTAVLAGFSRLFADPNRPEDSPDLFRREAEGLPVELNASIDATEREARLVAWRAYHRAVDRVVAGSMAPILFSMHTFTPVYEGARRAVEIGVLFDQEARLADALAKELLGDGFRVEPNEPYSGKLGLMYSVDRHARRYGRRGIELEVRQDLAADPAVREAVVAGAARAIRAFG